MVHHGLAVTQKMAGRPELVGSDVILVHRLLKNEVVERLGLTAYALISQACIDASGLKPAALGMVAHTEKYERIGEVAVVWCRVLGWSASGRINGKVELLHRSSWLTGSFL